MSELSAATGVPVATLKFYLREGVLHPGRATAPTQAVYDDSHVERIRLVRALTEVGGLPLARVRKVIAALDTPAERIDLLATAQLALTEPDQPPDDQPDTTRSRAWLKARGWRIDPDDPSVSDLEAAWQAADAVGLGLDTDRMDRYAEAAEHVARVDLATVPEEPAGAIRQVILGTILLDPVLITLRRLAHQHVSRQLAGG